MGTSLVHLSCMCVYPFIIMVVGSDAATKKSMLNLYHRSRVINASSTRKHTRDFPFIAEALANETPTISHYFCLMHSHVHVHTCTLILVIMQQYN